MNGKMRAGRKIRSIAAVLILCVTMLAGCGSSTSPEVTGADADGDRTKLIKREDSGKKSIVCTTFPQYDWMRNVLGRHEEEFGITLLLDNGMDLHNYQPTAEDMSKIASCDLFIYVGGASDAWVEDALREAVNEDMQVVNLMEVLSASVKEEELVEGMQGEEDGNAGETEPMEGTDRGGESENDAESGETETGEKADAGQEAETGEKTDSGKEAEAEEKADAGKEAETEEKADSGKKAETEEKAENVEEEKAGEKADSGQEEKAEEKADAGKEAETEEKADAGKETEIGGETDFGEEAEKLDVEYDEHIWLSLKNAQKITTELGNVMAELDAENAQEYKENAEKYNKKLVGLDEQYAAILDRATTNTVLFGDRFPFRYLFDDYGWKYYAAFVGCSAETEASFETIAFLAGKVDELDLHSVFVLDGSDQKIATAIINSTKNPSCEILSVNSMQAVTEKDVEEGVTYLSVMEENRKAFEKALTQ